PHSTALAVRVKAPEARIARAAEAGLGDVAHTTPVAPPDSDQDQRGASAPDRYCRAQVLAAKARSGSKWQGGPARRLRPPARRVARRKGMGWSCESRGSAPEVPECDPARTGRPPEAFGARPGVFHRELRGSPAAARGAAFFCGS